MSCVPFLIRITEFEEKRGRSSFILNELRPLFIAFLAKHVDPGDVDQGRGSQAPAPERYRVGTFCVTQRRTAG